MRAIDNINNKTTHHQSLHGRKSWSESRSMKSPGFLFDHCTFSAARCAIVKCISWKLKQVQNKLIPPRDQHSAHAAPSAWVTAQHTWSVLACYLQSRPPSLIPAPYKLWYWAADTIRHRLDNAACKLWTASPRPAWTINGEIISPRCLQNVKETDICLLKWWKVTVS